MAKRNKIIVSIFLLALVAGLLSYSLTGQAAPYRDIQVNFGVQPIDGKIYLKDPQLNNYKVNLGGGEIDTWEVMINGQARKNYGTLNENNELTIPTIESKQAVPVYGISRNNPGHMVTRSPEGLLWQTAAHDPDTGEKHTFLFEGDCINDEGISECPGVFPANALRVETGQMEPMPDFLRDSEGRAVTDTHRVRFSGEFYFSEEEIDDSPYSIPADRTTNHRIIPEKSEAITPGVEILAAGPSKEDPQMGWIKVSKYLTIDYNEEQEDYEISSTGTGHMHVRNYHMMVRSFWEATTYEYDVSIRVYYKPTSKPDLVALDIYPNEEIVVGRETSFTYEIQNIGQDVNDPFEVHVIAGSGETLVRKTFQRLGSGQVDSGTFTYTFPNSNPMDFFLDVDFYNAIDEEDETNNHLKKTFEPGDAGEVIITGDFDILPSPTQDYGGSFTFEPKEIEVIGCDFGYIRWRLEQGSSVHETGYIRSKAQPYGLSHYSDGYLGGKFGAGTILVTLFVASACGDEVPVAAKPIEILVDPNNGPPLFTAGFFPDRSYTRFPTMIIHEAVVGDKVTLGFVNFPPEEAPRDPEGYTPLRYYWDFAGSPSEWIRSFPSKYGFSNDREEYMNIVAEEEGYHRVRVQVCDSVGACDEAWVSLNVIPPNPVAVIKGPSTAKEGRPIPEPWDGSGSYSPVNRPITEYIWGGTKRDVYPDPGMYEVTLKVRDSAGLESLNTARHVITVQPDLPPIAELEFMPVTLRGIPVDFKNASRSEDGDEIVRNEVWYHYDSNHDGNFSNETRHNVTMRENNTFSLTFNKVGNYQVCVYVEEDYGKNDTKCYILEVTNEAPEVQFSVLGESPLPPEKEMKTLEPDLMMETWDVKTSKGTSVNNGQYWIEGDEIFTPYKLFQRHFLAPTGNNVKRLKAGYSTSSYSANFDREPYYFGERRFYFSNNNNSTTYFMEISEEGANMDEDNEGIPEFKSCIYITGNIAGVDYENNQIWAVNNYGSSERHYLYDIDRLFSGTNSCSEAHYSFYFVQNRNSSNYDPDYMPPGFKPEEDKYTEFNRPPSNQRSIRDKDGYYYVRVTYAYESHYCGNGLYAHTTYYRKQLDPNLTEIDTRTQNPEDFPYDWKFKKPTCENTEVVVGVSNDNSQVVFLEADYTVDRLRNYLEVHRDKITIRNNKTGQVVRTRTGGQFLAFHNDLIIIAEEVNNRYYIRFYDLNLNQVASSPVIKDISWYVNDNYYREQGYSYYSMPISHQAIVTADEKLIISNHLENILVMDFEGRVLHTYETLGRDVPNYTEDDYDSGYTYYESNYILKFSLVQDGTVFFAYTLGRGSSYNNYFMYIDTDADSNAEINVFGQWLHEDEIIRDGELFYTLKWDFATHANGASAGYSFRVQDHRNMYRVEHTPEQTRLVRIQNGNRTVLRTVNYPITIGQEYPFRIQVQADSIRVYDYRGVPIITTSNSTFREGMHGPYSDTEYFRIKNMRTVLSKFDTNWVKNTAIVDYNNEYETIYSDFENDPQIPQLNKWTYRHIDQNKFLNAGDGKSGLSSLHNTTVQSPHLVFDKVGVYEVSYAATDDPYPETQYRYPNNTFAEFRAESLPHKENIIVHRRPVIDDVRYAIRPDGTIEWQVDAHDPDRWLSPTNYSAPEEGKTYHDTKGIFEHRYQYLTPSGELKNGKLTRPQEAGEYIVYVTVRDEYGAWSDLAEASVYVSSPAPPDLPPVPGFILNLTQLTLDQNLVITSTAYDPEDGPASNLKHWYYIKKSDGYEQLVSTNRGTWNYKPLERGSYIIRQVVEDSAGNTAELAQTFEVVNRPPAVDVTVPSSTSASSPTKFEEHRPVFQWNYSDPDGDEQRRHELQIFRASDGANLLNSGIIHSDQKEWKAAADLPEDTVMYVRARAHDGYAWSAWSAPKYFYIRVNDPPEAEILFPDGSKEAPTIVDTVTPTIAWRQTDPNADTTFTGYALRFLDEQGNVIYETDQRSQHTKQNERSWTLESELPPRVNIQVQVRVKDEELWSEWSEPKWLYVNRPPTADFDYAPKPVWEGDTVNLLNRSSDPDGDELRFVWEIVYPDGTTKVIDHHADVTELFPHPGVYEVTLTADDGILQDRMTRLIDAGELLLLPEVQHTEFWREYHLSKGHEVDNDPKDFYSGEQFVLQAEVSPAPIEEVRAWMETTGRSGNRIQIETVLSPGTEHVHHGTLHDAILSSLEHGLPEGIEQIWFEAKYSNGMKKKADVPVRIIGISLEAVGVHRVR